MDNVSCYFNGFLFSPLRKVTSIASYYKNNKPPTSLHFVTLKATNST
uniref:Uncharacterized protein n=1 Tax=Rhizophora mucronata TaxID=61149 RepID=A0A2P2P4T8_RHIMU